MRNIIAVAIIGAGRMSALGERTPDAGVRARMRGSKSGRAIIIAV
ncbi:MAG: hypothetical protein ACR2P7_00905 [bacterium]